jgi:hypothetical protein
MLPALLKPQPGSLGLVSHWRVLLPYLLSLVLLVLQAGLFPKPLVALLAP